MAVTAVIFPSFDNKSRFVMKLFYNVTICGSVQLASRGRLADKKGYD